MGHRPGALGRAADRSHPSHDRRTARTAASARTATALEPLASLLARHHADLTVAARPLTDYAHLANQKENP